MRAYPTLLFKRIIISKFQKLGSVVKKGVPASGHTPVKSFEGRQSRFQSSYLVGGIGLLAPFGFDNRGGSIVYETLV